MDPNELNRFKSFVIQRYPNMNTKQLSGLEGFIESKQEKTFNAATAAKIGLAETGIKATRSAKKELFGEDFEKPEGSLQSGLKLFGATTDFVPFIQGDLTPWGRNLQLDLFDAVEALLRMRSGAAVPEDEVRRYLEGKGPKLTDPDEVKFRKLQTIEDEFETVLRAMGRKRDQRFTIERVD